MAASIKYLSPYRVTVSGVDLGSLKRWSNAFYYKTRLQTVAPPAYGAPIAGPSDLATFATNFGIAFFTGFPSFMSVNWQVQYFVFQQLVGKQYATPFKVISALVPGAPITVTTTTPNSFNTGDVVLISNVTIPSTANGLWFITVTSPTTFTLNGSVAAGGWSGDGYVQLAAGKPEFLIGDTYTVGPGATVGLIAGDAMPLFTALSIRRHNGGPGRHFRSRISMSPIGESQQKDGALTVGATGVISAGLAAFLVPMANGGSDAGSGQMDQYALSTTLALAEASPFTASNPFMSPITSMAVQPNLGSMVRRKPKLTSPIT